MTGGSDDWGFNRLVRKMFTAIHECARPVIAAVNGLDPGNRPGPAVHCGIILSGAWSCFKCMHLWWQSYTNHRHTGKSRLCVSRSVDFDNIMDSKSTGDFSCMRIVSGLDGRPVPAKPASASAPVVARSKAMWHLWTVCHAEPMVSWHLASEPV